MKFLFLTLLTLVFSLAACGNADKRDYDADKHSYVKNNSAGETASGGDSSQVEHAPVKRYSVKIIEAIPHAKDSYTQGLIYRDGFLYESSGERGFSSLRKVDPKTGEVLKKTNLEDIYFAEGIAEIGGKIYQLTWRSQICFVYDMKTLERETSLSYYGEGWGLCEYEDGFAMSDGTDVLKFVEPENFETVRSVAVTYEGKPQPMLNELELVDGKIWANVYQSDVVVIIDPQSGAVEGVVDMSILKEKIGNRKQADVLNGIAYDPKTGRIWATGKFWDTMFPVEISEERGTND